MSFENLINKKIKNLDTKNIFRKPELNLEIQVEKIYPYGNGRYWKALRLDWWKGKQVSLIAEDKSGNYIVRHCSGEVYYFDLNQKTTIKISTSVSEFLLKLSD